MNYEVLESNNVFKGKVFNLQVDKIRYSSGNYGIREVAVHPGGSVVVPVKDDGRIIMISQYRYPFKKFLIEFPAGKLEPNEDPKECAVRELQEETGFTAGKIEKLGSIATTPGFCTELLHIFIATELTPGKYNREEGEYGMKILEFDLKKIEEHIVNGEIIDSKTICGTYLTKEYLKKN
jgi:ADP-ribose diphosphatase